MLKFTSLPSSEANNTEEAMKATTGVYFTSFENEDEQSLYKALDKSLRKLEKSLPIEQAELKKIQEAANAFTVAVEEQADILRRIDWLERLYSTKEELDSLQTKEQVSTVLLSLADIQTSPLKSQLYEELNTLEKTLPSEELADKDQLMEQAIEEAGDEFLNLGKAGREFIIHKALNNKTPSIQEIQEMTKRLEQNAMKLRDTKDEAEFLLLIEKLPITSKINEDITERLLQQANWNGLLELNHMIRQIWRDIKKEEQIAREKELDTNPAATIDARKLIE